MKKSEKLEIYQNALELLQHDRRNDETEASGICEYIFRLVKDDYSMSDYCQFEDQQILEKYFPDFVAYLPENEFIGNYWWDFDKEGNDKREKVLKKLIKKLQKK